MVQTTLEGFREELRRTGGYRTAPEHRAASRRRPSGWVTFRFSLSVARVFPFCAVAQALGRLTTERWAEFCFSAITMPERYGMNVTLEGWGERAAYAGPVMYVANHRSTYETIALPPILLTYGPFRVVTKASLTRLPFLAKAAERMGLIAIGRENPKADLLKLYEVGCERLAAGESFLIFPQGTRDDVFSRRRFSSIAAKLAEKAGVPIVPIAVDSRCMPTRASGLFKDFGPVDTARDVRIAAGPVIPCGNSRVMHEQSFEWIAAKLDEWGMPTERN